MTANACKLRQGNGTLHTVQWKCANKNFGRNAATDSPRHPTLVSPTPPPDELLWSRPHPLKPSTVSSLSKALLCWDPEAPADALGGGWVPRGGPCATEWPGPWVVTSVPFVCLFWMALWWKAPRGGVGGGGIWPRKGQSQEFGGACMSESPFQK